MVPSKNVFSIIMFFSFQIRAEIGDFKTKITQTWTPKDLYSLVNTKHRFEIFVYLLIEF